MHGRRIVLSVVASLGLALAGGTVAAQQEQGPAQSPPGSTGDAVLEYWTPERMASAMPVPTPGVPTEGIALTAKPMASGDPGLVNGWAPGSGPYVEQRQTFARGEEPGFASPQAFGTAPTNPLAGPYGPFQRWTMQGSYTPYPRSVHGKLFFSLNGGNWVCSATVIGRSTIATAGHCVSDGSATWATNFLFCPSYYQLGAFPGRGCWSGVTATTSFQWFNAADPDYDYACIVTATTGTTVANKIGNVTGWVGRAWNWNDTPEMTFGYPAAAPFAGNIIQQTASVDWYDVDFTAGGPASKVIGSDLTGGSSGGGWFLSWRAPGAEVADTDDNPGTDPAGANNGPYINGVNSHKRCAGGTCASPPTATTGVFWQEMSSPRFRVDAGDINDSEDVFAGCLAHSNNNP
ncbi:MAG TPA: hypothetical protein PLH72_02995 [Vicinamibacterales bacterium]|nr:hypothetical protein [Vicinamibacterales bacterium]